MYLINNYTQIVLKTEVCLSKNRIALELERGGHNLVDANSPGADFCTGLSFCLGTTYLPEKVWLQKCNPEVVCNTPRYVVQSNCGSSFAVGRHL